jgi:hypothetical protein
MQAVSPFIDPVTYKKIGFVMGDKDLRIMEEHYDLADTEECLGGRNSSVFDFEAYGREMRQNDDALREQIAAMALSNLEVRQS